MHEIAIFQTVKSKVIISLFETVRLSVSISLRNLYNSLNGIKKILDRHFLRMPEWRIRPLEVAQGRNFKPAPVVLIAIDYAN